MTYYMYKDNANEWRWRLRSPNGRILADSGEGYRNKQDCRSAIQLVSTSGSARVVEI
jgi:uncharacterized protein